MQFKILILINNMKMLIIIIKKMIKNLNYDKDFISHNAIINILIKIK